MAPTKLADMPIAGNFLVPSVVISRRNALFVPSLMATLFLFILMKIADYGFTNSHVPLGQVSLQFALTEKNAKQMVTSFTDDQRFWAYVSLFLDYFFMAAYGLALVVSVLIRGNGSDISIIVASTVVLGVILDAIEGVFLYFLVSNPYHFHGALPVITTMCAILKFIMLGVGVVFIIKPFFNTHRSTVSQKGE